MAKRMRVDWLGGAGLRSIMQSGEVSSIVNGEAEKIRAAADNGGRSVYEVSPYMGVARARASVSTGNPAAIVENLKHDTLLRGLGGGGG